MARQSSRFYLLLMVSLLSTTAHAWAPAGPPGTPVSRNTAGAGAPGVGVAPVPGAAGRGAPGTPVSRNTAGAGAPGVGVAPVPGAPAHRR